jgi:hypothetical protein
MMQARDEKRKAGPWIATALAIAVLPKCVGCVAAYVAIGVSAGAMGRELCGVDARAGMFDGLVGAMWISAWLGAAVLAWIVADSRRRRSTCSTEIERTKSRGVG